MRLPIMYTMSWPERVNTSEHTWPRLDFLKASNLTFKKPDNAKYPSMDLAYAAGRAGGTMTGVLSAANEQVRAACCACGADCDHREMMLADYRCCLIHLPMIL